MPFPHQFREITKIVTTKGQILRQQIYFGWGSATDPAAGAYSAPPYHLDYLKSLLLRGERAGKERG